MQQPQFAAPPDLKDREVSFVSEIAPACYNSLSQKPILKVIQKIFRKDKGRGK
jgi:hypothetical protein